MSGPPNTSAERARTRESVPLRPTSEPFPQRLRTARGFVLGVGLSLVFWALVAVAVLWF